MYINSLFPLLLYSLANLHTFGWMVSASRMIGIGACSMVTHNLSPLTSPTNMNKDTTVGWWLIIPANSDPICHANGVGTANWSTASSDVMRLPWPFFAASRAMSCLSAPSVNIVVDV